MLKLEKIETRAVGGKDTKVRTYKNTMTGSTISTYLLHTDSQGNGWWTFEDLFTLPFIRQLAAKKVLDLYGNGLALDDIKQHTTQLKAILRSNDGEKFDKAMAKVLELESLSETMADPVKQCMGLCTVYLMLNDEQPDVWTNQETAAKMTLMTLDTSLQSFFLNWWTDIMRLSGQALKGLSRIVSTASELSENNTPAQSS